MPKNYSIRWPLVTLLFCFIASLIIFWPGIVSSDAVTQYNAARAGVYTDHHPPVMSFLWRYLDMLYQGPGLILLLHLVMLYAAAAVFAITFRDSKFKWWFAFFPLIPNILSYTPLIVKDLGFSYAYLLAGALLSYIIVNKVTKLKYVVLTLVLVLLFYGTAVKFQARYLLIFFTLGAGYCLDYKLNKKTFITGAILYIVLLQAMFSLNSYLVPNKQESHSWQLVKLYDLAAISVQLNQPLFPDFVKQNSNFDFEKVKHLFLDSAIDPLVFPVNSPLKSGYNLQQRTELFAYWRSTILEHPFLYLKIRFNLWANNFISVPSQKSHPASFFKDTILGPLLSQPHVYSAVDLAFKSFSVLLQFIWLLPLLLIYTYLGIVKLKSSKYAVPLLMFSATSIGLLVVLFFFSMAATARYVFICTCLVHASHGFAYKCWLVKQ
jgi:hypothetical protein